MSKELIWLWTTSKVLVQQTLSCYQKHLRFHLHVSLSFALESIPGSQCLEGTSRVATQKSSVTATRLLQRYTKSFIATSLGMFFTGPISGENGITDITSTLAIGFTKAHLVNRRGGRSFIENWRSSLKISSKLVLLRNFVWQGRHF